MIHVGRDSESLYLWDDTALFAPVRVPLDPDSPWARAIVTHAAAATGERPGRIRWILRAAQITETARRWAA